MSFSLVLSFGQAKERTIVTLDSRMRGNDKLIGGGPIMYTDIDGQEVCELLDYEKFDAGYTYYSEFNSGNLSSAGHTIIA